MYEDAKYHAEYLTCGSCHEEAVVVYRLSSRTEYHCEACGASDWDNEDE